jgi:hypothetical protein
MTELRECLRTVVKLMFLTLRRNVLQTKFLEMGHYIQRRQTVHI